MISVERDFTDADIDAYIAEQEREWLDSIIENLSIGGRALVDKARAKTKDDGGFGNITWNLRGSIGMCIVNDLGKIVETYFPPIGKGEHGREVGTDLAERLAVYSRDNQEISMVFVAGESYAVFVQAKGKDVIKHVIGDNMEAELRKLLE